MNGGMDVLSSPSALLSTTGYIPLEGLCVTVLFSEKLAEQSLSDVGRYAKSLLKCLKSALCDPCDLRCKALNVILFLLEAGSPE